MINFEGANICFLLIPTRNSLKTLAKTLNISEFLRLRDYGTPLFDVRSPGEFAHGHISQASNLPLFTDEERKLIGTLYKQQGRAIAVEKGFALTGLKMADWAKMAATFTEQDAVLMHCWRGGMRSNAMAFLFESVGAQPIVLRGGYKAYRNATQEEFARTRKFIVVGGSTGSGKTELLHELREQGETIIDLEALARHKGSVFGSLGMDEQPSVEQFENNLFEALRVIPDNTRIWIEDESRSIGRNFIPPPFYRLMHEAPLVVLSNSLQQRVERLVYDYGKFDPQELIAAFLRIQKRLGGKATQDAVSAVNSGDLHVAAEIALYYYDKAYHHTLSEHINDRIYQLEGENKSMSQVAANAIHLANQLEQHYE
jgi:tRNA 2-selenouridine synthase